MKRLLLTLLLVLAPAAPHAEGLQEFFGIQLGAPCAVCSEPLQELGEMSTVAVNLRSYQVHPPQPHPDLELYQVRVSKKSGKVVDVSGVALFENESKARRTFTTLQHEYEQRLGKPELKELYRAARCVFRPRKGESVLTLLLREDMLERRWIVYVNAMDRKAFAKAGK